MVQNQIPTIVIHDVGRSRTTDSLNQCIDTDVHVQKSCKDGARRVRQSITLG